MRFSHQSIGKIFFEGEEGEHSYSKHSDDDNNSADTRKPLWRLLITWYSFFVQSLKWDEAAASATTCLIGDGGDDAHDDADSVDGGAAADATAAAAAVFWLWSSEVLNLA